MKKTPALFALALCASTLCAVCTGAAPAEQRKVLSVHETVAVFAGFNEHRCMGRTSLCPDECGHSGTLAVFNQIIYTRYEKPGEYGDPKAERYQFLFEDNRKNKKIPTALHEKLAGLKPGDSVVLHWVHEYVTRDGSSFPERTVTKLEGSAVPEPGSAAWDREVSLRLGIPLPEKGGPAPLSADWFDRVSTLSGVIDAEGHGPDSGSEEWLRAVHHKLFAQP